MIAGKYGSVNASTGLSYTEMEYDYAVSAGKPVMAFLHGDLGALRSDLCESTDDRRTQLENFRKKVEKAKHVKYWKSAEDLAGQVALSYTKFVKFYPATGWVRADQVTSSESLKELLDAKARIEELEAAVEKTKTSAPAGAEELAQGSEEYHLNYQVSAKTANVSAYSAKTISIWAQSTPTWDAIFASIAPRLLQEAEESALKAGIERFLLLRDGGDSIQAVRDEVKARDDIGDDVKLAGWRATVTPDDFGTILVQLRALGLIRKSDRKRSLSDTGTYWALTPYGEARTVQLRAIKKGQTKAIAFPEEDSEDSDDS